MPTSAVIQGLINPRLIFPEEDRISKMGNLRTDDSLNVSSIRAMA